MFVACDLEYSTNVNIDDTQTALRKYGWSA
jgi:hypothetical protein